MKVEASRTMEQLENFHVGKAGVYRHAWFIKKDGGRFEFWLPSKQQQVGLLKLSLLEKRSHANIQEKFFAE